MNINNIKNKFFNFNIGNTINYYLNILFLF